MKPLSDLFDADEYNRWMEQAKHTLESARRDAASGDYDWACFKAQQAAEYAVKGLLRALGLVTVGHSILKLASQLEQLSIDTPQEFGKWARDLDRHYIPPRYADAYPAGSPFEFYDQPTAEQALENCRSLLAFIEECVRNAQGTSG